MEDGGAVGRVRVRERREGVEDDGGREGAGRGAGVEPDLGGGAAGGEVEEAVAVEVAEVDPLHAGDGGDALRRGEGGAREAGEEGEGGAAVVGDDEVEEAVVVEVAEVEGDRGVAGGEGGA